jgi:23S rRNA (adenine2503-C2)-methyltransferase
VTAKPDIRSLPRTNLAERLQAWRQPAYRLDQLLDWLYPKAAAAWDEMSNLPRELRARLAGEFELRLPSLVRIQGSGDATRKFLWRMEDHALIESVLIPASPALYGEPSDRHTLCVSTQVGCAYGCRFCASGLDGWKRNLNADEIVGQVLAVERWHRHQEPRVELGTAPAPGSSAERLVNNLVIMGMGEPLANYENLIQALGILNATWGLAIGARKITISTSGLVPEIRRLAAEPQQFGLAISLHGATDEVRGRLMPVNRKYPLTALLGACRDYLRAKGRTITLEYILIAGVNDDPSQARCLALLARELHAKVNLIPYNRVTGLDWERPSEQRQEAFLAAVLAAGGRATLRREKGHEIDAACGQLRLRTERETPERRPRQ